MKKKSRNITVEDMGDAAIGFIFIIIGTVLIYGLIGIIINSNPYLLEDSNGQLIYIGYLSVCILIVICSVLVLFGVAIITYSLLVEQT